MVLRKIIALLLISVTNFTYSQNLNKCGENIDFLLKTLEGKSPSYKNLITNKFEFKLKADSIRNIALKDNNPYNCKEYLQRIMRNIQDGHLQILVNNSINLKNSDSLKSFFKSTKFNALEKINLDSLKTANHNNGQIYHSLNDSVIIYIHQSSLNTYKGYVNESNSKYWKKGELIINFTKGNNYYDGVIYNLFKDPSYYKMENLVDLFKRFNISKYKKEDVNIFNLNKEKLSFEIINDNILYVSIRSFRNLTIEENKEFINFFENSVLPNYKKYENIIFDVRNNPGGAMAYESLLSGIKKDKKPKNIYVLQNRKTASAAEHFILQLSQVKNIKTIGENTLGMTAFRDIFQEKFPNNNYIIFIPTKIFYKKYKDLLQYEYVGIKPNIELLENENWLNKTVEIINNNKL